MDLLNSTIESALNNVSNNGNVLDQLVYFSWYDYTLFVVMLAFSTAIGIYFGCFGQKQASAEEYLLGGKEMAVFPIAMSLVAR